MGPAVSDTWEKYSLECKSLDIFSCFFSLLFCWQISLVSHLLAEGVGATLSAAFVLLH